MVSRESIQRELAAWAERLQVDDGAPNINVLTVCRRLGIEVEIAFARSPRKAEAYIDFLRSPIKICINRAGDTTGGYRLAPDGENFLTARERFAVAHEIGHWIAYTQLDLEPRPASTIGKGSDSSGYWRQEDLMDGFAASLLVPEWVISSCVGSAAREAATSLGKPRYWAEKLNVPSRAVFQAICERSDNLAFLQIKSQSESLPSMIITDRKSMEGRDTVDKEARERKKGVVLFSASGAQLDFPRRGAKIWVTGAETRELRKYQLRIKQLRVLSARQDRARRYAPLEGASDDFCVSWKLGRGEKAGLSTSVFSCLFHRGEVDQQLLLFE